MSGPMAEQRLRAELVDYSKRLHTRGWVANHDGNLSVRLGSGRILCTPTATSKAEVSADSLLIVDEAGARVSGKSKPFGELGLHLAVLMDRPDAQAVVHAHPPYATALGSSGRGLECFLPEAVVSLGPVVPLVPLAAPGPAAVAALRPYLLHFDAVLLAGNGALAWGDSVEQAYLRLELVEHLCRIFLLALPAGGVKPLPVALVPPLLESRRKAGLGPEARGVTAPSPLAPSPAPTAAAQDRIGELIRQEIAATLGGSR
jgi:L-fuculose-phosphate aldolase